MPLQQFRLPDLGEGLTEGDILKWMVAVGDTIKVNDTIAEVETVKAAVELPSPFAGVVTELHAAEGETVPVGSVIISVNSGSGTADLVPAGAAPAEDEKQMTLVGYGPREESGGRRRRRRPEATAAGAQTSMNVPPPSAPHPAPPPATADPVAPAAPRVSLQAGGGGGTRALAKPPVRKLAKDLGVDLASVTATGTGGTVTRDDVHAAAAGVPARDEPAGGSVARSALGGAEYRTTELTAHHSSSGATKTARETRVPIKGVRKHTAAAMVASAFTAPHVTEFLTVDVTAAMDLRDRIAARREFRDARVTPLLLVARACVIALGRTPSLNASWDDVAQEIVYKHYVNLGIAAATERGLVVPNVKDAERLSLRELASGVQALVDTAREGRTTPADMSGGTFTITNVGVFGVDSGTPILNPGESGILAFGAVRRMPWVVGTGADERIEPRWVTQLALSFDHRVVDGQQGSQFLADVGAILADPGLALL